MKTRSRFHRAALSLLVGIAASAPLGCSSTGGPVGTNAARQSDAVDLTAQADDLLAGGQTDEALFVLARAIEKNPRLTVAHMKMGEIHKDSGDYEAAADAYGDAAAVEPRNFDAQYNHGLMLHLIDRMTEAVRAYLRALAVRPEDFDANFNLATAYLQLNESNQALTYAKRAVRLNPQHGPSHANLGAVYSALDNHAQAVREYEAAAELMELSPEILLNWAESLGKLGRVDPSRYEEMATMIESIIREAPSAASFERLGFARFKLGNFDSAQDAFLRSLEQDELYYPAMNGLGVCLLNEYLYSQKQNRAAHGEAMAYFQKSLRVNRNQPRILELVTRYR